MGERVRYEVEGEIATLTLDRPERYNAIDDELPGALRRAVERADEDPDVHVIVLTGAGEAFCSGYDLQRYAERPRPTEGSQEMPWDPTEDFMSLWHSYTPVICKVNGPAGAKRMLLTGDLIDGVEAAEMGLVMEAVPGDELDGRVDELARRIAGVPRNQLMMQKLVINQAIANMGLETTQMVATFFDGMARHTPEGIAFKERCEEVGFKQAVAERDQGDLL